MISDPLDNQLLISAPQEVQNRLINSISAGDAHILWSDNIFKTTALTFKYITEADECCLPLVVAVWVDNLSATQLKFFSLASNSGKVIPIAFSDHNQDKLKAALENGAARAVLTDSICTGFLNLIKARTNHSDDKAIVIEPETVSDPDTTENTANPKDDKLDDFEERMSRLNEQISVSKEELDSLFMDDIK